MSQSIHGAPRVFCGRVLAFLALAALTAACSGPAAQDPQGTQDRSGALLDGDGGGIGIGIGDDGVSLKLHVCGEVSAYAASSSDSDGSLSIDGKSHTIAKGAQTSGMDQVKVGADVCCDLTLLGTEESAATAVACEVKVAVEVDICGTVEGYAKATSTSDGWCQIEGKKYTISKGTDVQNEAMLTVGAEVCLKGSVDAGGELIGGATVSDNGDSNVVVKTKVCGTLSAYQAASASADGSMTINGHSYSLQAGAKVSGSESLQVDASVCCELMLSASDPDLASGASCTAQASVQLDVCGTVDAYVAATATDDGWVQMDGKKYPIDAGCSIDGEAMLKAHAEVCLHASLNAGGEISGHASITDNSHSSGSGSGSSGSGGSSSGGSGSGGSGSGGSGSGDDGDYGSGDNGSAGSGPGDDGGYGSGSGGSAGSGSGSGGSAGSDSGSGDNGGYGYDYGDGCGTCPGGSMGSGAGGSGGSDNGSGSDSGSGSGNDDGDVDLDGKLHLHVCGEVSAYAASSSSKDGSLCVGNHTYSLGAGSKMSGEDTLKVGAHVCCDLTVSTAHKRSALDASCTARVDLDTSGGSRPRDREEQTSKQPPLTNNGNDKGVPEMSGCSVPLAGTTGGAGGWLGLALAGLVAARRRRSE